MADLGEAEPGMQHLAVPHRRGIMEEKDSWVDRPILQAAVVAHHQPGTIAPVLPGAQAVPGLQIVFQELLLRMQAAAAEIQQVRVVQAVAVLVRLPV